MVVPLSNEKLNYHFKGGNPSVVPELPQDNIEMQDVVEKAGGWALGQSCRDLGREPGGGAGPGSSTGGDRGTQCHLCHNLMLLPKRMSPISHTVSHLPVFAQAGLSSGNTFPLPTRL